MKRKHVLVIAGAALLLLSSSTAYAVSAIKVLVNGTPLQLEAEPRNENGTILAPVRSVAEALGATVTWNEDGQEVNIAGAQPSADQQRIALLQQALAAAGPDEAIRLWTKGLQTRNGALQLAAFSPELQKLKEPSFAKLNWVTGVSSPWIDQVDISEGTATADGTYTYKVKLDWRTSADLDRVLDWSQIPSFSVVVSKIGDQWYVTDFPGREKLVSAELPDGTAISSQGDWSETGGVKLQLQTLSFASDAPDPVQSIVGNHSEVVEKETVQLPNISAPATLALVERTAPAADGPSDPQYEYWLIVTEDQADQPGMKYAYCLVGTAGSDREQAKQTVLTAGHTLTLTPWRESPEI